MAHTLDQLSNDLRRLPTVVGFKIAEAIAPVISELAQKSFDRSQTPYGVAWRPGEHGQTITLRKSGAMERTLRYVAIGTKLRVALGTSYAKYQISKRYVFPRQGSPLPDDYRAAIERTAADVVKEEMRR